MKSLRLQELTARGKPAPALIEFQLEPKDYERLLRRTYKETFKMDPERALREARETMAATNASAASATGLPGARPATASLKGAAQLMPALQSQAPAQAANPGAAAITGVPPGRPKTADELVLEEMEQRLAAASPATDEDLRELMQQRAASVQKFLLDTGKVAAERIFLVAPKPVDPTVKGIARATFSLD